MKIKSLFLKNFFQLAIGTIIAQVISIAVSPLITRIYTKEELGIYTLLLTIVSIFGSVICGRYDMKIVSVSTERESQALCKGSIQITLASSVIVTLGYYTYLIFFTKESSYTAQYTFWVFPILIGTGLVNIFTSYNNRHKEYAIISKVGILRSLIQSGFSVILGYMHFNVFGLILSQILGVFSGLSWQSKEFRKNYKSPISQKEVNKVLLNNSKQPLFSVPAVLAATSAYSITNIFISSLYGLSVLGSYSISFRLLGMPLSIISTNISRLFFKEGSIEYDKTRSVKRTFLKISLLTFLIALPMVVFLELFAPQLFSFFFGASWKDAGVYVQYLAPMFGIRLVVTSLATSLIILNKQQFEMIIQFTYLIASVVIFLIAKASIFSIEKYLLIYNLIFSVIYLCYYMILMKLCLKNKEVN